MTFDNFLDSGSQQSHSISFCVLLSEKKKNKNSYYYADKQLVIKKLVLVAW